MPREGALIVFVNAGAPHGRVDQRVQKLCGQDTTTRGQVYHRHGLLEDIPPWRIKRGVLVVRGEDRERVVQLIEPYAREVYGWPVSLRPGERSRLPLPT